MNYELLLPDIVHSSLTKCKMEPPRSTLQVNARAQFILADLKHDLHPNK